jgi:DNA-binding NtrC family response regulator
MATILCVDDDLAVRSTLIAAVEHAGHKGRDAASVAAALQVLVAGGVDLILSDYQMPGLDGLDFLDLLKRENIDVPLVMVTGYASIENAVTAIKAGAVDYITKPIDARQLDLTIERALDVVKLRRENRALKHEVTSLRRNQEILGNSPALLKALNEVAMAAPTRATVLLLGESGTGKELFARAVHNQSDRHHAPFLQLNCAALPEGLIESALFGHEKGAFTGAIKRVEGAFERANHGTLLLDEISEMRLDLQAKLLRVLQEQEFERVGGDQKIQVDTRIVATSNRDLAADAAAGKFRQDLYFRLSVVPIRIPPLRERADDIPLLAMRFAMRAAEDAKKQIEGIAPEAIEWLRAQPWPGNVRELQHVVERAVILSREPLVPLHRFEGAPRTRARAEEPTREAATTDDGAIVLHSLNVEEAERALIEAALARTDGNRTRAAAMLGMSVRTLRSKLNRDGADSAD